MLGIAIGDVLARFLGLFKEGGHVDNVLPGRILVELEPVAVLSFEVLAVRLEQVLTVEGAGNCRIVGKGDDLTLLVEATASGQEVGEPGVVTISLRILR